MRKAVTIIFLFNESEWIPLIIWETIFRRDESLVKNVADYRPEIKNLFLVSYRSGSIKGLTRPVPFRNLARK